MSRSSWGVVVAALFAIVAWATPVPERWRGLLVLLGWVALGISCLGWLLAHMKWSQQLRSSRKAVQPMALLIIFILGGLLAASAWLLVPKLSASDDKEREQRRELKQRAQTLSKDLLEFAAERKRNDPSYEIRDSLPVNASEEQRHGQWQRDAERGLRYSMETNSQYDIKFGGKVLVVRNELAELGLRDKELDELWENPTNYFGMTIVANRISALAERLPAT